MICIRVFAAALSLSGIYFFSSARAEPLKYHMNYKQIRDEGPLQERQLYAIDVKCTPRGAAEPTDASLYKQNFLSRTYYTASHFMIITQKPVLDTPALNALPTDALVIVHPYSTAKGSGFRDGDCDQTKVVVGGTPFHILAVASFSTDNQVDPTVTMIRSFLGIVPPLLSLFGGGVPAAIVTKYITGVDSITTPYKDLLAKLNESEIYGEAHTLRVGQIVIEAPFSREVVTVRPITSLVQDRQYSFTQFFAQQLTSVTTQVSPDDHFAACLGVKTALADLGFSSPADRGYALLQLGLKAKFVREQLLDCLPYEEALAVSKLDKDYVWRNADPDKQRFTEEQVRDRHNVAPGDFVPKVQPAYTNEVKHLLYDLVTALSISGRKGSADQEQILTIAGILADQIIVTDKSTKQILGSEKQIRREDFVTKLFSKGINRFGCYTPTSGAGLDQVGDGAVAAFLGFIIRPDASEATKADAAVFRPFFSDGKINGLTTSQDGGMIDAILNGQTSCGELTIKPLPKS